MKDQHTKIRGYRDLSQQEIDLMNRVKDQGEALRGLIEELSMQENIDRRWLAIGTTDLQTGIMALVRSIAQPTTF